MNNGQSTANKGEQLEDKVLNNLVVGVFKGCEAEWMRLARAKGREGECVLCQLINQKKHLADDL